MVRKKLFRVYGHGLLDICSLPDSGNHSNLTVIYKPTREDIKLSWIIIALVVIANLPNTLAWTSMETSIMNALTLNVIIDLSRLQSTQMGWIQRLFISQKPEWWQSSSQVARMDSPSVRWPPSSWQWLLPRSFLLKASLMGLIDFRIQNLHFKSLILKSKIFVI